LLTNGFFFLFAWFVCLLAQISLWLLIKNDRLRGANEKAVKCNIANMIDIEWHDKLVKSLARRERPWAAGRADQFNYITDWTSYVCMSRDTENDLHRFLWNLENLSLW
jgi:hypothetical protein